jgi:glycine betaine/proline transport system ATP-binding protein
VLDNAAYALEIQGVGRTERRERARDILERVGLGDRADAPRPALRRHASAGRHRPRPDGRHRHPADGRGLLGARPAHPPRDAESSWWSCSELGRTIVFITHDLNEAMFLGDRIAVMRSHRAERHTGRS